MVGNDIVDLSDPGAQPGARHPRFDARVFAASERRLLTSAGDPLRWIYWAAKESAYKVARRLDPSCVFAPSRFVVRLDDALRGCVQTDAADFPVAVDVRDGRVHAVATRPGGSPERADAAVSRLPAHDRDDPGHAAPGRAARRLAIACAARALSLEPWRLSIDRERRAPRLLLCEDTPVGSLSLSHHGRFVACAFDATSLAGPT